VGILEGESSAEIDAPNDRVWKVRSDVDGSPRSQAGTRSPVALERDDADRPAPADIETESRRRTLGIQVRFAYEPPARPTCEQSRGELKSVFGMLRKQLVGRCANELKVELEGDS
jgi:hypothetical protein